MTDGKTLQLVMVSAGVGSPSSTQMLTQKIAATITEIAHQEKLPIELSVIQVRDFASDLAHAVTTGMQSESLRSSLQQLRMADGLVAATPVYKAGYSGLFKQFFDLVDDDALLATPVLLAATAGTPRHALVPDAQMRPLFSYLRAVPIPTSVFAATEDWGSGKKLDERICRATIELIYQMKSNVRHDVRTQASKLYRTTFSTDTSADLDEIDFDTDLMRLATGG
ncbi:NADH-dependent FMN reductase [Actinomycetaceae bacterium WB03_NA08]|uniref:NADH-dependent FMN reductase n=1 Tax=Scrofimicrobium canadense TaxID=2652290 RepID=A0A6N7VQP8_9ACTO|nr:CE1759 family FMN reductase [Scrofimicrobium canadense]MSS84054.1 NADH-dependent FMN reductase [Scrofimicrobium canadense]